MGKELRLDTCQCEHVDHFQDPKSHKYNEHTSVSKVETMYGTFRMCEECLEDRHMIHLSE